MLDWQEIKTVLLDMDGTILDLHFDNHFWLEHLPLRYAQINNLELSVVKEQLFAQMNALRGTLPWYCIDYWSEQFSLDVKSLKAEIKHKIAWRTGTQEFLRWLAERNNTRVILVTNAHLDSMHLKNQQCDFLSHLETFVSSHQYGHPKESPLFWQALQDQLDFDPKRALFLDDGESILKAAQDFGVAHLWTITQPDSQRPIRTDLNYPSVDSLTELLP